MGQQSERILPVGILFRLLNSIPQWVLTHRLRFPGDCAQKTGKDMSRFSQDYRDHLAKSFETQTYVYEQAVSVWTSVNSELMSSLAGSCGLGKMKRLPTGQCPLGSPTAGYRRRSGTRREGE
jgi:hypothetical protein